MNTGMDIVLEKYGLTTRQEERERWREETREEEAPAADDPKDEPVATGGASEADGPVLMDDLMAATIRREMEDLADDDTRSRRTNLLPAGIIKSALHEVERTPGTCDSRVIVCFHAALR